MLSVGGTEFVELTKVQPRSEVRIDGVLVSLHSRGPTPMGRPWVRPAAFGVLQLCMHKLGRESMTDMLTTAVLFERVDAMDAEELKNKMVEEFQERFGLDEAREWIEKGFEDDRTQSWRGVLKAKLEKLYEDEHSGDLRDSVREYVQESVRGDEDEEDDE